MNDTAPDAAAPMTDGTAPRPASDGLARWVSGMLAICTVIIVVVVIAAQLLDKEHFESGCQTQWAAGQPEAIPIELAADQAALAAAFDGEWSQRARCKGLKIEALYAQSVADREFVMPIYTLMCLALAIWPYLFMRAGDRAASLRGRALLALIAIVVTIVTLWLDVTENEALEDLLALAAKSVASTGQVDVPTDRIDAARAASLWKWSAMSALLLCLGLGLAALPRWRWRLCALVLVAGALVTGVGAAFVAWPTSFAGMLPDGNAAAFGHDAIRWGLFLGAAAFVVFAAIRLDAFGHIVRCCCWAFRTLRAMREALRAARLTCGSRTPFDR